jgi:hypothetical protein
MSNNNTQTSSIEVTETTFLVNAERYFVTETEITLSNKIEIELSKYC